MAEESVVEVLPRVKNWNYKLWLRFVTVVAFGLIFLLWTWFLSMAVFISVQSSAQNNTIEVVVICNV